MKLPSVFCLIVLLSCLATIAHAQQSPTASAATTNPEPPKLGSIKGRVTGNDGQPLASIPVVAIPFGRNGARRQGVPGQPPAMPSQAVTDDDGNFEFVNLAPVSYGISASTPGYVAPLPETSEGEEENRSNLYRLGDVANITLVKGGVITGKVFNANGEPLTGVTLTAIRVGNVNGEADELSAVRNFGRNWRTDDRGMYRIYGLIPGTYIVQAGQMGDQGRPLSPFSQDAPTYYPSSARDAALPLAVRPGEELTGIDIRYRAEKGRSVGGKAVLAQTSKTATPPVNQRRADDFNTTEIRLSVPGTDSVVATTFQSDSIRSNGQTPGFAFYNIPDGDYEISARRSLGSGESDLVSENRLVSVRGADVSGIQLSLAPLALLSGKVALEKAAANSAAACPSPRRSFTEEIVLAIQRDEPGTNNNRRTSPPRSVAPLTGGDFLFRNLEAGRWRLSVRLPDENWYVRSTSPATPTAVAASRKPAQAATAAAVSNIGRNGALLKSGEKLTGVIVTVSEGAAGLKGSLSDSSRGKLQIHLIPAEKENADDVLRYAHANTTGEGTFQFKHIAPGRYLLLAKPVKADSDKLIWDAAQRTALRKEAEAAGTVVEFTACQRTNDFKLNLK